MFPVFATEKAVPPYIIYRRVITDRARRHSGVSGESQVTFTVTCWATTYDGSMDLSNKVRAVLDGVNGTWGSMRIGHCHITNESDVFEPSPELMERQFYGRQLTVDIQHTE